MTVHTYQNMSEQQYTGVLLTFIRVPEWLLLTTMSLKYTVDHKPHEEFYNVLSLTQIHYILKYSSYKP
jgi:hypothetical protein